MLKKGQCEADVVKCKDGTACAKSQYCHKDKCEGEGVCTDKPLGCPDIYAPVCGCNGKTTSSQAVNAFNVNTPSDGGQSRIK